MPIHQKEACEGKFCPLHNPSNHGMQQWPINIRETNLIERMCKHSIGHPDPDSAAYIAKFHNHELQIWMSHGCDGCCAKALDEVQEKLQEDKANLRKRQVVLYKDVFPTL